jgi:hypothetical protein
MKHPTKPFNLEQAKAGHPVVTREGYPVRILAFDLNNEKYPIAASIQFQEREDVESFSKEGSFNIQSGKEDPLDLLMAPVKKEGWVNLYNFGERTTTGGVIFSSEKDAINHSVFNGTNINRVATIKIEWEE